LKDVANIEFGKLDVRYLLNLNGKPSAAITIKQSYGSNASQVMGRKSKISRNQKYHSPGVDYEISYDASNF
jgi:HAE1 family hydrophobic/amphiphilic exporter-1